MKNITKYIASFTLLLAAPFLTLSTSAKAFAKSTVEATANSIKYSLKNMGYYIGLAKKSVQTLKGKVSLPEKLYYSVTTRSHQHGVIVPTDTSFPALQNTHFSSGKNILTFPNGFKVQAKWQGPTGFIFTTEGYYYDFQFLENSKIEIPKKAKLRELPKIDIELMADSQLEFSNSYHSEEDEDIMSEISSNLKGALKHLFSNFSYTKKITLKDLTFMNKTLGAHSYIKLPFSSSELSGDVSMVNDSPFVKYSGVVRGSGDDSARLKSYLRGDSKETVLLEFPPSNENIVINLKDIISRINKINPDKTTLLEVSTVYKDFLSLHPFYDGNGRMARALLDFSLLKAGFPQLAEHNANTAKVHWMTAEEVALAIADSFAY